MKRREFLKQLGVGCVAASSLLFENPLRPRFRIARAANGKVLVVIFQKGGCDGLNTIVPYGDPDYYVHRPTLSIAAPDAANPAAALDIDGFFGFHPALAPFQSIYGAGDMAILPAVHYPAATRSHFDSMFWMQCATTGPMSNPKGWLNSHLSSQAGAGPLRAMGYMHADSTGLPDSLRGPARVSSFGDMRDFGLDLPPTQETAVLEQLRPLYEASAGGTNEYEALVNQSGQVLADDVNLIRSIDFHGYTPGNGAVYPETDLGISLQQTAQLIKEGVGLELAALSSTGWDTHDGQGTANDPTSLHYTLLDDFARSIAAFYQDLGSLMSDVMVMTMTEFGRTARENGAGGTDHGNASAWFVIGKDVSGGLQLGSGWPGLAPTNLNEDRDLAYTIDYRDIFSEIVLRHLGNPNLAAVIPAHAYSPVGFLPA